MQLQDLGKNPTGHLTIDSSSSPLPDLFPPTKTSADEKDGKIKDFTSFNAFIPEHFMGNVSRIITYLMNILSCALLGMRGVSICGIMYMRVRFRITI